MVELVIDEFDQLFAQSLNIYMAGLQNGCGILIFGEGKQETALLCVPAMTFGGEANGSGAGFDQDCAIA